MIVKTTKAQFNRFKQSFQMWVEAFGLKDYEVYFAHEPLVGAGATIAIDQNAKAVTVAMSSDIPKVDHEHFSPEDHAKHEALHLLLNRIMWIGGRRCISESELQEEWERLVRVLEKVL